MLRSGSINWIKLPDYENIELEILPNNLSSKLDAIPEEIRKHVPFLGLWEGLIAIVHYDDEEDRYYMSFAPADYEKNWKLEKDQEAEFTHWAELKLPEDY